MPIIASVGGVTFTGNDTQVFQAITLKAGLKLLSKGIKPNSRWTKKSALHTAGNILGKRYKLSQIDVAIADLDAWIKERSNANH